jgi:hypothetical protein
MASELVDQIARLVQAGVLTISPIHDPRKKDEGTFRVLDLPKELREMVYELVVVNPNAFVFPSGRRTGVQQPDLAMTCREIRNEVLPVFYKNNTFTIEIGAAVRAKKIGAPLEGMAAIEKWSNVIEKKGWFGLIRKWAVVYTAEQPSPFRHAQGRVTTTTLLASRMMGLKRLPGVVEEASDDIFLSIQFPKNNLEEGTPRVEVHREAACILPGLEGYGVCQIRVTPEWVNAGVLRVMNWAEDMRKAQGLTTGLVRA